MIENMEVEFGRTSELAFIREANTSQSVIDVFNGLDKVLGNELFSGYFI